VLNHNQWLDPISRGTVSQGTFGALLGSAQENTEATERSSSALAFASNSSFNFNLRAPLKRPIYFGDDYYFGEAELKSVLCGIAAR